MTTGAAGSLPLRAHLANAFGRTTLCDRAREWWRIDLGVLAAPPPAAAPPPPAVPAAIPFSARVNRVSPAFEVLRRRELQREALNQRTVPRSAAAGRSRARGGGAGAPPPTTLRWALVPGGGERVLRALARRAGGAPRAVALSPAGGAAGRDGGEAAPPPAGVSFVGADGSVLRLRRWAPPHGGGGGGAVRSPSAVRCHFALARDAEVHVEAVRDEVRAWLVVSVRKHRRVVDVAKEVAAHARSTLALLRRHASGAAHGDVVRGVGRQVGDRERAAPRPREAERAALAVAGE